MQAHLDDYSLVASYEQHINSRCCLGMRSSTYHMHWQDPLCAYLAGFVVGCNGTYFVIGCNGHYVERICTFVDAINAVLIREIDTIDPSILHGVCKWDTTLCFLALHFHACLL